MNMSRLGTRWHLLSPVLNQGAPAILFCFIWLYLSAAGPGPWSLDAMRGSGGGVETSESRGGIRRAYD